MAVTEVSICKLALTRVGQDPNSLTALADATKEGRLCTVHYEPSRDAVLRAHPWNFAIKRADLALTTQPITDITAANPAVVTYSGADSYANGDRVYIAAVVGMTEINGLYGTVASVNTGANTFQLSDINSSAFTAYVSGGTITIAPPFEFGFKFPLPTDCLKVIRTESDSVGIDAEYRIEGRYLLAYDDTFAIEYIAQITDPTQFDALFVDLLAQRLAAEMCTAFTNNANMTENLWRIYNDKLGEARSTDAQEGTPRELNVDSWTAARL